MVLLLIKEMKIWGVIDRLDRISNQISTSNAIGVAHVAQNAVQTAALYEMNDALRYQVSELEETNGHLADIEANVADIAQTTRLISEQFTYELKLHERTNDLLSGFIELTDEGFRKLTREEQINNNFNWEAWLDTSTGKVFQNWLPHAQDYLSQYFSNTDSMQAARETDFMRNLRLRLTPYPDTMNRRIVNFVPKDIPEFPPYAPTDKKFNLGIRIGLGIVGVVLTIILFVIWDIANLAFHLFDPFIRIVGYELFSNVSVITFIALFYFIPYFVIKYAWYRTYEKPHRLEYDSIRLEYEQNAHEAAELNSLLLERKRVALSIRSQVIDSLNVDLPSAESWSSAQDRTRVEDILHVLNTIRSKPEIVRDGLPEIIDFHYSTPSAYPEISTSMKSILPQLTLNSKEKMKDIIMH
ncbi:hypothetical protein [Alloscardovia macacae]|uniref:Uncharacterized protein n=1 Tax=Alloscardovia macacae TaxID=1160091 RepID=A0A261F5W4_9BIFI|nr:hypothetical protein [Alloscardovia macacae]OZG54478.1 hypothetical protein ALMA_0939 [Alloscardovia macacae]